MRVYTFFSALPGIDTERELALLSKWAESWERKGWEPVILSDLDAFKANPMTSGAIRSSAELARGPLPKGYSAACHLRWVAHRAHGGLHVDYDVMNRNFPPAAMKGILLLNREDRPIMLFGSACPCAVWASAAHCDAMLALTARQMLAPDRSTGELASVCHDQAVFAKTPHVFTMLAPPVCQNYGTPGWESSLLVHFANAVAANPRHELVARAMP